MPVSRWLKTRKSPKGDPALRKRARTTTRAGWRRWGSSDSCCGKRTETAGGRRGKRQTATLSCWRANRMEKRKPQTWRKAKGRASLSFIRSKPGRSSEVLTTLPASRNSRSMSLKMYWIELLNQCWLIEWSTLWNPVHDSDCFRFCSCWSLWW